MRSSGRRQARAVGAHFSVLTSAKPTPNPTPQPANLHYIRLGASLVPSSLCSVPVLITVEGTAELGQRPSAARIHYIHSLNQLFNVLTFILSHFKLLFCFLFLRRRRRINLLASRNTIVELSPPTVFSRASHPHHIHYTHPSYLRVVARPGPGSVICLRRRLGWAEQTIIIWTLQWTGWILNCVSNPATRKIPKHGPFVAGNARPCIRSRRIRRRVRRG